MYPHHPISFAKALSWRPGNGLGVLNLHQATQHRRSLDLFPPLRLLRSFPLSNFSDPSFLIGFLEKEEAAKDLLYYTGRNTFTRHPLQ